MESKIKRVLSVAETYNPYLRKSTEKIDFSTALIHELHKKPEDRRQSNTPFSYSPEIHTFTVELFHANARIPGQEYPPIPGRTPPEPTVGYIQTFSKHSRRRMLNVLSRINYKSYKKVYFLTLTYHNLMPDNFVVFKNHLKLFVKSMNSNSNKFDYIWRAENQKRGAPHLHFLLLYKIHPDTWNEKILLEKFRDKWLSLTKDLNVSSHEFGVKIEEATDKHRIQNYLAKYIAKEDETDSLFYLGRRWGTSRTLRIDILHKIRIDLTDYQRVCEALFWYCQRNLDRSKRKNKEMSPEFKDYLLSYYYKQLYISPIDFIYLLRMFKIDFYIDEIPDLIFANKDHPIKGSETYYNQYPEQQERLISA
jgi:hypothetical protein